MKIGEILIEGYAALAPMAGVADRAMREICMSYGAAYCVGELASSKGICQGDPKSAELLTAGEQERPFAAQIFGDDPATMAEAARRALEFNPDFIDINMGCPAPKVASSGGGSSLLKDPFRAQSVVAEVVAAVDLPVTVKIRTGWDEKSINAVDIALGCEAAGAAAITVHGRTRAQMYAPGVDVETIAAVKRAVSIPVIANGDVDSPAAAAKMYEQTGCDFVMVGRAAMGAPWLFAQINAYLSEGRVLPEPPLSARFLTLLNQIELMEKYKDPKIVFLEARKHTAWYMHGLRGAAELRRQCGQITCMADVHAICARAMELNPDM